MALTAVVVASKALVEQNASIIRDIAALLKKIGLSENLITEWIERPSAPTVRLARWINILPASESRHDADPGGLYAHTLRVAYHAIHMAQQKLAASVPAHERIKAVMAVFTSALVHDIAKAWFMSVGCSEKTSVWNISQGPLLAEDNRHGFVPAGTTVTITHRYGRSTKFLGHQTIGVYFIPHIVPLSLLAHTVGLRQANNIPAILAAHLGSPLYALEDILHEADALAVKEVAPKAAECRRSATREAVSRAPAVIHEFIQAFRALAQHNRLTINQVSDPQRAPYILVSDTHTILPYQYGPRSKHSMITVVYHMAKNMVLSSNGSGQEARKAFYASGGPQDLMEALHAYAASHENRVSGGICCIDTGAQHQHTDTEVMGIVYHGKGKTVIHGFLMTNDFLWGGTPQVDTNQNDKDSWRIALRSHPRGIVLPASDFGFSPAVDDFAMPSAQLAGAVVNTSSPITRLGSIAQSLWHAIDSWAPVIHSGALGEQHALLAQRLAQENTALDEETALFVLESVLDRLRLIKPEDDSHVGPPRLIIAHSSGASERVDTANADPHEAASRDESGENRSLHRVSHGAQTSGTHVPSGECHQSDAPHADTNHDDGECTGRQQSDESAGASVVVAQEQDNIRQFVTKGMFLFASLYWLKKTVPRNIHDHLIFNIESDGIYIVSWPDSFVTYLRLMDDGRSMCVIDDDVENALFGFISRSFVMQSLGILPGEDGNPVRRVEISCANMQARRLALVVKPPTNTHWKSSMSQVDLGNPKAQILVMGQITSWRGI